MGFSSSLQGPASHEALLARQDAEIRLLENMKRCLGLRIKAEREHAVALNSFALQAAKNMESVPELSGSTVARNAIQCCREIHFGNLMFVCLFSMQSAPISSKILGVRRFKNSY